jgi:primase-polymerase (primpol)-like protein
MFEPIQQPFTVDNLPPCLETLCSDGADFGMDDTKACLRCIALYYYTLAKKVKMDEDSYNLIPMLRFINERSHDKLSDDEIDTLNETVRTSSRSKITCREFKKSPTLKACCVSEDCQFSDGSIDADSTAKKAADIIMVRGDVLKFLVNQAQKNHKGDTDVIKHLMASIASSCSLTSAGIQPELNGTKGHGKTDAVRAVFHLVPDRWKLAASISAKALYYYTDLLAGTIIFSDDVQWSDDLISTVKRSMGSFQEPQVHFTLDKNREPLPQTMPPRLVWWLSSVESVADDQLKDRQYSLDIDEGKDHSVEVSD